MTRDRSPASALTERLLTPCILNWVFNKSTESVFIAWLLAVERMSSLLQDHAARCVAVRLVMKQNKISISFTNISVKTKMSLELRLSDSDRVNVKYSEKQLFQCHLSTRNLRWTGPVSIPGPRSNRPATNCLKSYRSSYYLHV